MSVQNNIIGLTDFKNMKTNGKISSYTNLINFLNIGRKGLTIEIPAPPPPKLKSKAMNWDIIVICQNNTEIH